MRINYTPIRDSIFNTLKEDIRLDPTNIAKRYILQLLKQRWIPGAGLPSILIYLDGKPDESHRAIGYSPFPNLLFTIKPIIGFPPNKKDGIIETPSALLTKLGVADIQTPEIADNAIHELTDVVEEIIRGDDTTHKANRYLNNGQIKVALPVSTDFGFVKAENTYYIFSEIHLRVEMRLTV